MGVATKMPKLKKRLGNAKWQISYNGKTIVRKVDRQIVNGKVVPTAIINGKKRILER